MSKDQREIVHKLRILRHAREIGADLIVVGTYPCDEEKADAARAVSFGDGRGSVLAPAAMVDRGTLPNVIARLEFYRPAFPQSSRLVH